jgi:hypothetical protein
MKMKLNKELKAQEPADGGTMPNRTPLVTHTKLQIINH